MKRIRTTYMGPSTVEEKKEDGTIVIKVLPDKDIYEDLVHEEDKVIDMTAMESASEEDPDEESADDLSIVTVDSLANIDKEQVRELWKEMSETKAKEANIYNRLSNMVEEMSPAIIQETIQKQLQNQGATYQHVLKTCSKKLGVLQFLRELWLVGI